MRIKNNFLANGFIKTVKFHLVITMALKSMDSAFIYIHLVKSFKVNLRTTKKMDLVNTFIWMAVDMKGFTSKTKE